jgi:hypothetical protein
VKVCQLFFATAQHAARAMNVLFFGLVAISVHAGILLLRFRYRVDCGERAESSLHSRKKEVDPVEATQTVSIARRLARAKSAMPSALALNLRQPSALSRSRSLPVPNCRDAPGHIRRLLAP